MLHNLQCLSLNQQCLVPGFIVLDQYLDHNKIYLHMLSFQSRPNQSDDLYNRGIAGKRPQKRYEPGVVYGVSNQSPQEFHGQFSISHKYCISERHTPSNSDLGTRSISLLETRKKPPSRCQINRVPNVKLNPIYMETHDFTGPYRNNTIDPSYSATNHYEKALVESAGRSLQFRRQSGAFSQFVDKNHKMNALCPLVGDERTGQRIARTKKELFQYSRRRRESFKIDKIKHFSLPNINNLLTQQEKKQVINSLSVHKNTSPNLASPQVTLENIETADSKVLKGSYSMASNKAGRIQSIGSSWKTSKIREERNRFHGQVERLLERRKHPESLRPQDYPTLNKNMGNDSFLKELQRTKESRTVFL